jgi:glycosyltransferase involved in cell wall biosynthesis
MCYGVKLPPFEHSLALVQRERGMIIFSGNMYHGPNVDGALFFLREIYPTILSRYPGATLYIVGSHPDVRVVAAAQAYGPRVVITGRVRDMSEYLARAMVSVCPVRLQIGVQTKVLEALAHGTPVVSTSAGNSGIQGYSGSELWVEDDPLRFAARVISLLEGDGWLAFSERGRKFVAEQFSWERSAAELEIHVEELLHPI